MGDYCSLCLMFLLPAWTCSHLLCLWRSTMSSPREPSLTPSPLTALGTTLQCCLDSQYLETWPASFPLHFTHHQFVSDQDLSVLRLSHQPTCLHLCCLHPSPSLAHLVFLTLDQSPRLLLCTATLGIILMCKLEHTTIPLTHGYCELQNPFTDWEALGGPPLLDIETSVETLWLDPTEVVSLLPPCPVASHFQGMLCY